MSMHEEQKLMRAPLEAPPSHSCATCTGPTTAGQRIKIAVTVCSTECEQDLDVLMELGRRCVNQYVHKESCTECGKLCSAFGKWCRTDGCRRSWPPAGINKHAAKTITSARPAISDPTAGEVLALLGTDAEDKKGEFGGWEGYSAASETQDEQDVEVLHVKMPEKRKRKATRDKKRPPRGTVNTHPSYVIKPKPKWKPHTEKKQSELKAKTRNGMNTTESGVHTKTMKMKESPSVFISEVWKHVPDKADDQSPHDE